ncbi:DNA-binding transcriptional regulator [Treponema sp.]
MLRIELLVGLDDAFGRAIARGVVRFAKSRSDWKLYGYGRLFADPREIEGSEGPRADGLIARVESADQAKALAALQLPIVDVAGAYPGSGFREVNNDDFLTGRRAGEYLRGLGFKRFAFCSVAGTAWSRLRTQGFTEASGYSIQDLRSFERPLEWWKERNRESDDFAKWLKGLGAPTALFTCNDIVGLKASETCRRASIAVPGDLAILGVDDEDLLCELADPSLSSIKLDCEGIGTAAAELLAGMLRSATVPRVLRIAPRDIVERESTRTIASEDELASRAAAWIRANASRGVNVSQLVKAMPASRRSLELRFKAALGLSLGDALKEARLDQSKRLLDSTDLTLDELADACGFGSLQRFHVAFKKREGITPGAWRKAGR